jgi:hypothetical protein
MRRRAAVRRRFGRGPATVQQCRLAAPAPEACGALPAANEFGSPGTSRCRRPTISLPPYMRRTLPFLLAGALAGCATLRERFPSHEDVFTPIDVQLGEARLVAGDTVWSLSEHGYELVARERALLAQAQPALEQAATRYRRYFGDDPPMVTVELQTASRRPARADSARADSVARDTLPAAGRRRRVSLVLPAPSPDQRAGDAPLVQLISATPVARGWLSATADQLRPAAAAADSAGSGAGSAGAGRDDARIPDWIEIAAADLVGGSLRQDQLIAELARQPEKLVPLRSFVTSARPAAAGYGDRPEARPGAPPSSPDGRPPAPRRSEPPRLEGAILFDAQAVAVVHFLLVKEGAAFIGDLVRTLAAGRSLTDALAGAREVPHELDGLETNFKAWLATQRTERRG